MLLRLLVAYPKHSYNLQNSFLVFVCLFHSTFSVIPIAFSMFIGHKLLCGLCLFGVLCNMTRKREVHAVWCALAFYLMNFRDDIEW